MAVNPYSAASISGYNSSPPPDDGSQTSANKVEWQKHKQKLADPIRTLAEAINTNALGACNALALIDWVYSTTTATVQEADWNGGMLQSATDPIYYPDPSLFENGWHHYVFNGSTGIVPLEATGTDFFLNTASTPVLASGVSLYPGRGVQVMNTSTGWLVIGDPGTTATVRAGEVMQTQYQFTTTCVSATEVIPFDNTLPVATEGNQFLTAAITPSKVGNLIEVETLTWGSANTNTSFQVAMFLGTASSAVSVGSRSGLATDNLDNIPVTYWATATGTSSMTFALRAGANTGAHVINGTSSGNRFGGGLISYIKIIEYNV